MFPSTERVRTNICWMVCRDGNFKICLSALGREEKKLYNVHIVHWGEWAESPFMWNASWQNGKSPFVWNASWQNGKWPNKGYNWVIVGDTWIGLRWRSKTLQPTSQNWGQYLGALRETLSSVHFLPTGCWSCWKWVKEHSGRWVTSSAVTQVSLSNVLYMISVFIFAFIFPQIQIQIRRTMVDTMQWPQVSLPNGASGERAKH